MSRAAAAARRELQAILRSRPLLTALFLVPGFAILLIAAMLSRGALEALPVALVDAAQTQTSRALVSAISAQSGLSVTAALASEAEADAQLRQGHAWAYVVIPSDYGKISSGQLAPVRIAYNATYLSVGSVLERDISRAVTGVVTEQAMAAAERRGLQVSDARLPQVQVHVLFNPEASFEWYLQALIQPAMLHLLAACLGVYAVGREFEDGMLERWRRETGGGMMALLGKFVPYLVILSLWAAAWMVWLVGFRGWRMGGSLAFTYGAQVMMLAASLALSAAITLVSRRSGLGFSASAFYAGSALAYSGGSLPIKGAPSVVVWWSEALPFTHYLRLQMDQFLGSPVAIDLWPAALLLIYVLVGIAFSFWGAERRA